MEEVWRQQLSQMQDQVADYAYDWNECLEMVASLPPSRETHEYLELLTPRLKQMQRRFNRVEHNAKDRCWCIYNYTYEMYHFFKQAYDGKIIVTPNAIRILDEDLDPATTEQLQKRLSSSV